MVMMCGGTPIIVDYNSDHHHLVCPIESIKESISPKTKAIILNTPCNPSGIVFSDEYIQEVADIAINNNLVVISDEVYKCLVFDGIPRPRSISSLPQMKDRTVYVNSMSKEYCMTGWRLGYVLSFPEMIAAMTKLQENVVACAPLPSQYAAIEALRTDKDYTLGMREVFAKRRDLMMNLLDQQSILHCIKPQATFYMMIDISKTGMKSEEFAYRLLEKAHVAVVPGKIYGEMCDDYVRLAITMDEDTIVKGIRRMVEFVDSL
jgi:aminotransferase